MSFGRRKWFVFSLIFLFGIFLSGGIAFSQYLKILEVGEWGKSIAYVDVHIEGNLAYCASATYGVDIIDISSPSNPILCENYDTPGYAHAVFARSNHAYIADGREGLHIINISNPSQPVAVGHYKTQIALTDVRVRGNCAYVVVKERGIQIVDISLPNSPYWLGECFFALGEIKDIYLEGKYLYALTNFSLSSWGDKGSQLAIIDVSNPLNPQLASLDRNDEYDFYQGIYVKDQYAYVIDDGGELRLFNISDPSKPRLSRRYDIGGSISITGAENHLYINSYQELKIYDLSEPKKPKIIGQLDSEVNSAGICVKGRHAYCVNSHLFTHSMDWDTTQWGLDIIDISNPHQPAKAGHYGSTLISAIKDGFVSDRYAYISDSKNGIQVLDVS